jgi:DNA-binding transcriptional MocR family regulator
MDSANAEDLLYERVASHVESLIAAGALRSGDRTLNRLLGGILRDMSTAGASYEPPPGLLTLRRQLAKRSLAWGMSASEDDYIITSGAMEALNLALRATVRPGDAVAVSTPTYFGILQLLEEHGVRVVEVPSHAEHGMDLAALELALKQLDIKACIAIPSFDNPNGSLMSFEARVRLAALVERFDVPLIEDDIYGDLAWDHSRPSPVKAHDRGGRVLLCGSFSKTLAAGYRVGWIMPGRYGERVARLKFSHSVATSTLEQMAVAEYLSLGGYDRHLRKLRTRLNQQVRAFREAIAASFPAGTAVSDPRGGYLLWVTLPREVDAMQLQAAAAKRGIVIAPGPVFAAGQRYKNNLRLNCGFPWSDRIASALRTLGELATQLASDNRRAR